jgi:hypothetical protein
MKTNLRGNRKPETSLINSFAKVRSLLPQLLLPFLLFATVAQANTDVIFTFRNSQGSTRDFSATNIVLELKMLSAITVSGTSIVYRSSTRHTNSETGTLTVTNLEPGVYSCSITPKTDQNTFQITVTNSAAPINASSIITTATNAVSGASQGYSVASANSRFIIRPTATNGQYLATPDGTNWYGSNVSASASLTTTKTLWVDAEFGSDLTGIRGRFDKPYATIGQAKTNAIAGDLIRVFPGTYTDRDILKPGVNYHFYAGARMTNYYSGAGSTRGVFDDWTGATTNVIDGNGQFDYFSAAFGDHGFMLTTNPATEIHFKAKKVTCANDDSVSGLIAAFMVTNCARMYIDVDEYLDTKIADPDVESSAYCIYWEAGQMFANIRNAKTEFGYIAWGNNSANVTNDLYYSGHFAESTLGPTFYMSAVTRNLKMWLDVLEIRADSSIAISSVNGKTGKMYVKAEKISGSPCVAADGDTEIWVTAQKLTVSGLGGSWVSTHGGCALSIDVMQYEQTQTMGAGFNLNGGTNHFKGGRAVTTNGPTNGMD